MTAPAAPTRRQVSPSLLVGALALVALVLWTVFTLAGRDDAAGSDDKAKEAVRAALFAGHEMWGRFDAADPAELASALSLVLADSPAAVVTAQASTSPSEVSLAPTADGFTVAVRGSGDRCWYGRFTPGEASRYGVGTGDCEARLRAADSVDEPLRFPADA